MPRTPWRSRTRKTPLSPQLEHFLSRGCSGGTGCERGHSASLDLFLLRGRLLRGQFDELKHLWRMYGAEVKREHAAQVWAEKVIVLPLGPFPNVPPVECGENHTQGGI